jgi:hypothetical protein
MEIELGEIFMKRLIFVLLIMTCSVSWADWKFSVESDTFTDYFDKSTIRRNGSIAKMWIMRDYSEVQTGSDESYKSAKILMSYNCRNETAAVASMIYYSESMGTGDPVWTGTIKERWLEFSPISPGSVDKANWKIACGKK